MITLKEQEQIIAVVRRYGLTYFWNFFFGFFVMAVSFFFMFWLFAHDWWGQILFVFGILVGLFILLKTLFLWRRNQLIITTHRVVDIYQNGIFDKTISEIPYNKIEDVFGRIKGFFGTIFRYGELNIITGSGKVQIVVCKIRKPVLLQQKINEIRERCVLS